MGNSTPGSPAREPRQTIWRWPDRLLGPPPGLKELSLGCWGLLLAFVIVRFAVPLVIQLRTGVQTMHLLPADFIYFYGIGRLAREYPLTYLYDYVLQLRVFNQIYPLQDGAYGPSPYPPFVALFFSLFARLPFGAAFAIWMLASLALYTAGIGAIAKRAFAGAPFESSIVYCLALGYYPFLFGTLINGQLAAAAVFAVGMAIAAETSDRPFLSGLALSALAYKPTLLLVILPMLVLTRRFRALGGFGAGCGVLFLMATAFGGFAIWPAYANFLHLFGRVAGLSDRSGLPLWKFVDAGSCLQAIAGGRSTIATATTLAATALIAIVLAMLWWKSARAARPVQSLVWSTAITWTLLISVYVPIYDAILVVPAMVLTIGALKELGWRTACNWIVFLAAAIEAASWATSSIAIAHRVQLLSIALALLGCSQLILLYCAIFAHERRQPDGPQATAGVA
jgi:hypothetical protein